MHRLFFLLFLAGIAIPAFADDLKLANGKTLSGVVISRAEADGVVVTTDDGVRKVPFSDLAPDLVHKYHPEPAAPTPGATLSSPVTYTVGGFLSLKWGASIDDARQVMASRPDFVFAPTKSTASRLVYIGGNFAGARASSLSLSFAEGRFYKGIVMLDTTKDTIKSVWSEMVEGIRKKYGPPITDNFEHLLADWKFPSEASPSETVACTALGGESSLMILYVEEALKKKANLDSEQPHPNKDL